MGLFGAFLPEDYFAVCGVVLQDDGVSDVVVEGVDGVVFACVDGGPRACIEVLVPPLELTR